MDDVENKEDIRQFVDAFYASVRKDPLIGPVFNDAIGEDNWDMHLERMYGFWNTILFSEQDYRGNPFSKHVPLPIEEKHFSRWLELFRITINELFEGPKAEEALVRSKAIAGVFQHKLTYLRS